MMKMCALALDWGWLCLWLCEQYSTVQNLVNISMYKSIPKGYFAELYCTSCQPYSRYLEISATILTLIQKQHTGVQLLDFCSAPSAFSATILTLIQKQHECLIYPNTTYKHGHHFWQCRSHTHCLTFVCSWFLSSWHCFTFPCLSDRVKNLFMGYFPMHAWSTSRQVSHLKLSEKSDAICLPAWTRLHYKC